MAYTFKNVKVKLHREHHELFFKLIYRTHINCFDKEEKEKWFPNSGSENWKEFYRPENLYGDNPWSLANNFDRVPLAEMAGRELKDIVTEIGGEIGRPFSKSEYCQTLAKYIYDRFRDYKYSKATSITIGGSNRPKSKYNGYIFFWYIGYKNYDDFKEKHPLPTTTDTGFSSVFNTLKREGEWDEDVWEGMEGVWRFEGLEESVPARDMTEKYPIDLAMHDGSTMQDYIRNIQGKAIEYDRRFCYPFDVVSKKMKPGFLLLEGTIKDELESEPGKLIKNENENLASSPYWDFKAICTVRKLGEGEIYLCLDFEMFPQNVPLNSGHGSVRTFGYAMLRFTSRKKEYAEGFYLSSRFGIFDNVIDKKFDGGLRIAFGRCAFRQLEKG